MDAFRREFTNTDHGQPPAYRAGTDAGDAPVAPDDTHEDAPAEVREDAHGTQRRAMRHTDVDALARELTAILENPGHPAYAGVRLRQVDRLFGEIDAHLRAGGVLPSGWHVDPHASVPAHTYVTVAYDVTSEELRSRGDVTAARRALASAARWWEALNSAMRDGGPLPEPWQRAET